MDKRKKTELTGALTWSVLDAAAEVTVFPEFYTLPPPLDVVPSVGKGLIPLSAVAPIAIGKKKHKEKIVDFGRGAAVYGMGSFINELSRRVLMRNLGLFRVQRTAMAFNGSRVPLSGALQGRYGKTTGGYTPTAYAGNAVGKYSKTTAYSAPMGYVGTTYPRR